MSDVTVAIASFGDRSWFDLGSQRAAASAFAQGCPVVYVHGLTLHDARNAALAQVNTEFVIHLDADDELAPDYVEQMLTGTADIRVPAMQFIAHGRPYQPRIMRVAGHRHDCIADCLPDGNFICIGAMVRADVLRRAGGWRDFPLYEDWDAWTRCWQVGATIESIPRAIYRAHVDPASRNRAPSPEDKLAGHGLVHRANFPEHYEVTA